MQQSMSKQGSSEKLLQLNDNIEDGEVITSLPPKLERRASVVDQKNHQ
jgi:hypothetical protein